MKGYSSVSGYNPEIYIYNIIHIDIVELFFLWEGMKKTDFSLQSQHPSPLSGHIELLLKSNFKSSKSITAGKIIKCHTKS